MKITFTKWGKPSHEVQTLVEDYTRRMGGYLNVKTEVLKEAKSPPPLEPQWVWIALDERGESWSSKDLAMNLQKWKDDPGVAGLRFLVGGPYGLPPKAKEKCRKIWSLSKGTLPTDLAWLVSIEQVYRSLSILAGSPYHHGE